VKSRQVLKIGFILLLAAGAGLAGYWLMKPDKPRSMPVDNFKSEAKGPRVNAREKAQTPVNPVVEPKTRASDLITRALQPEEDDDVPGTPDELGSITGRVLDLRGRPIVGLAFSARLGWPAKGTSNLETNAEGVFHGIGLAPGAWNLHLGNARYDIREWPDRVIVEGGKQTIVKPDMVLCPSVVLRVRLLKDDGSVLSTRDAIDREMLVTAVFWSPGNLTSRRTSSEPAEHSPGASPDEPVDGVITWHAIPIDAYEFTLNATGFMVTAPTPLRLVEGEANEVSVRLSPLDTAVNDEPRLAGSVRGRIVDTKGSPLAGIVVFAHESEEKDSFGSTFRSDDQVKTDAEGYYRFPKLRAGKWYFIIASSEYTVKTDPGRVEIQEGTETIVPSDFVLNPPTVLKVRILSENGNAIPGDSVRAIFVVTGRNGATTRVGASLDKDGWATVKPVPSDATEMTINVPGYKISGTVKLNLVEGELTDCGEVRLAPMG
jgi:protocatechuate 3,4-dioxygenase beta subunit